MKNKKGVVHKKPVVKIKKPTATSKKVKPRSNSKDSGKSTDSNGKQRGRSHSKDSGSTPRKCCFRKNSKKPGQKEVIPVRYSGVDLNPEDRPSFSNELPEPYLDSESNSSLDTADSEDSLTIHTKPPYGVNKAFDTKEYANILLDDKLYEPGSNKVYGLYEEDEEEVEEGDDDKPFVYGHGTAWDEGNWNKGKLLAEGIKSKRFRGSSPFDIEPPLPPLNFVEYQPKIGRYYGNKVRVLLWWIVTILGLLGRMPVHSYKTKGKIVFGFKWFSPVALFFYINSFIISSVVICCFVGAVAVLFRFPGVENSPWKPAHAYMLEEKFFMYRNSYMMFITLMLFINCLPCIWAFMTRSRFAAKYFQFWGDAIEILQLDVTPFARNFTLIGFAIFLILYGIMCLVAITNYAPIAGGVGSILAWTQGRLFIPNILEWKYFQFARIFGTFSYLLILFICRIYFFIYVFLTLMLRRAFYIWNQRLDRLVNFTDPFDTSSRMASKWGLRNIYKEHIMLIQLVEGANHLYAGIIDTYFYTVTFGFAFEFFFTMKTMGSGVEFNEVRRRDRYFMVPYFLQSLMVLVGVTYGGGNVILEAYKFARPIRKRSFMADRPKHFNLFLKSMTNSLFRTRPICMKGNGHFLLTKNFVITVMAFVAISTTLLIAINPRANLAISDLDFKHQKYLNVHRQQVLLSFWEGTAYTENVIPEIYRTLNITTSFYWKDYDFFANLTGVRPKDPFDEHFEEEDISK